MFVEYLIVFFSSLLCEYIDSTLGMGFGTTLTPLLMLLGLDPLAIVPAVLLSEFATGITASFFHNKFGNVELNAHSKDTRVALILASCSIIGSIVAVSLALKLPKIIVKLYIGFLVLAMGLLILSKYRSRSGFSWKKIIALGLLSSFNKAISGGGYGPVVVGGQLLSGIESKRAIGITSLAEGLTCLAGFIAYVALGGLNSLSWSLTLSLVAGALTSTPIAAYSVKEFDPKKVKKYVSLAMVFLGLLTLLQFLVI